MERSKKSKKFTISLPPRVFELVEEAVRQGHYASRSALVCEAVRRLLERELSLIARLKREDEEG